MASTATPGSSKNPMYISPAPTELDRPPVLDYWSIPSGDSMGIVGDSDEDSFDLMAEITRAKEHPGFGEFLQWLVARYDLEDDLPDEHTWGAADGDPLEDFKDFARWLVETNQGCWDTSCDDNPQPLADHDKVWPDNQLGDSQLYPPEDAPYPPDNSEVTEVVVGYIPYTKTWPDHMAHVMEGWEWSQCFVRAGGFIIDFVGPSELKHVPARCQFPLTICTCLPVEDGLEEGECEEEEGTYEDYTEFPEQDPKPTETNAEGHDDGMWDGDDQDGGEWGTELGWDFRDDDSSNHKLCTYPGPESADCHHVETELEQVMDALVASPLNEIMCEHCHCQWNMLYINKYW